MWQSGRDGGSSRLRGAARALTGSRHYFEAPFITEHERRARADVATMLRAGVLIRAVTTSDARDAGAWSEAAALPATSFAGRGIASKATSDAQIIAQLRRGWIEMALWGVSLDRGVVDSYGGRFRFELVGAFPGVPAWLASGTKAEEQEIITGGRYDVARIREEGGVTVVTLRHRGVVGRHVGDDPVLLGMLAQVPDVTRSWLTRVGDGQRLGVEFGDRITLTAARAPDGPVKVSGSGHGHPAAAVRDRVDATAALWADVAGAGVGA